MTMILINNESTPNIHYKRKALSSLVNDLKRKTINYDGIY